MDENTIWMTAAQMREVYGDDAEIEAVILACVSLGQGDAASHRHWIDVANAITDMASAMAIAEARQGWRLVC